MVQVALFGSVKFWPSFFHLSCWDRIKSLNLYIWSLDRILFVLQIVTCIIIWYKVFMQMCPNLISNWANVGCVWAITLPLAAGRFCNRHESCCIWQLTYFYFLFWNDVWIRSSRFGVNDLTLYVRMPFQLKFRLWMLVFDWDEGSTISSSPNSEGFATNPCPQKWCLWFSRRIPPNYRIKQPPHHEEITIGARRCAGCRRPKPQLSVWWCNIISKYIVGIL